MRLEGKVFSKSVAALIGILTMGTALASGHDPLLSRAFGACMEKAGGVTPSVTDCQSAEYERQDKRLNIAYRRLQGALSKTKLEELRKVQRAWLTYAEARCAFYWDSTDFSGQLDRCLLYTSPSPRD